MKKGCGIVIASVVLLACAGIITIYLLSSKYEDQRKQPGEAEMWAAEKFILSYDRVEASGNTPAAIIFAERYSRQLRLSRQLLFTEGKAGAASLTKGYFLTYCFLTDDSLVVLVHVPELRRYSEDAKVSLGEYAWTLATLEIRSQFPAVKRLALGLKGSLNYSTIFTGIITINEDPIKGIQKRHRPISSEILWPFFTSTTVKTKEPNQAPEITIRTATDPAPSSSPSASEDRASP